MVLNVKISLLWFYSSWGCT